MSTKRKTRSNSARSPRSRGTERVVATDGVYSNPHFMNSVAALLGTVVKVHTATGSIYEGILKTFSAQFEIVIELAHKVDPENPFVINTDTLVEKMIFKPQDIIKLAILDQDVDYALKDVFQTDSAISKFNGQVTERELEPWDSSGNNADDFELDGNTSNGWDVNEMFKKNEQMYGVTSNFDHGLSAYTTPLHKDMKDYKDAEAKATKIANEIESTTYYKSRSELENGDEEDKFAAVVRPNSNSENNNDGAVKYVCPPKRKTQQGSKINRSSPSSPPQSAPNHTPKNNNSPSYPQSHPAPSPAVRDNVTRERDRERINGVSDSPKPQRMSNNTRHGRAFPSNDSPRYSANGNIGSGANNNSSNSGAPAENRNPNNHGSNNTTFNAAATTTNESHHRKPPIPVAHSSEHVNSASQPQTQRKASRSRDDQINELKKFGNDLKLTEPEEKKVTIPTNESDHTTNPPRPSEINSEHPQTSNPRTTNSNPQETIPAATKGPMKSKLNPNAKEFVYNPNTKPFTPRAASTPNQSRPHTPQTPGYGPSVTSMPMTMQYLVTQPPYPPTSNSNRFRKVPHIGISQTSQMQVAAATGQPLLAPAPMHTQFTVPYSPQAHIVPQPYHHQMVRMVAQTGGGMVPPVLTAINYSPDSSTQGQIPYMGPGGMGPHPHHPHHPHVHPQNNSSSPQSNNSNQLGSNSAGGGGGNASGASANAGGPPPPQGYPPSPAGSYNQPPPTGGAPHPQNPTHTFPIMCPIIPSPHPPPHPASQHSHQMMAAQSTVQPYLHHHHPHQHSSSVGSQQPHHIQVILPPPSQ